MGSRARDTVSIPRPNRQPRQNANVGPVFIMYKRKEALDEIVTRVTTSTAPETSFVAGDDGIEHLVWPISDEGTVAAIREAFERCVCASVRQSVNCSCYQPTHILTSSLD